MSTSTTAVTLQGGSLPLDTFHHHSLRRHPPERSRLDSAPAPRPRECPAGLPDPTQPSPSQHHQPRGPSQRPPSQPQPQPQPQAQPPASPPQQSSSSSSPYSPPTLNACSTPHLRHNHPHRGLLLKLLSIGISFLTAGINDGSLGALIPHLLRAYAQPESGSSPSSASPGDGPGPGPDGSDGGGGDGDGGKLSTAAVAALYAATLAGWILAAASSTHLSRLRLRIRLGHLTGSGFRSSGSGYKRGTGTGTELGLGLGGMLALGAGLQVLAQALRVLPFSAAGSGPGSAGAPPAPWGLFAASFGVASLGQGYQDAWGNAFVASLAGGGSDAGGEGQGGDSGRRGVGDDDNTGGGGGGGGGFVGGRDGVGGDGEDRTTGGGVNGVHRWLGFIHAMYMAGCLVAPFGAASIAATGEGRWWVFYSVPLGVGVVNLALVLVAFRDVLGAGGGKGGGNREVAAEAADERQEERGGVTKSATRLVRDALSTRSVWLLSLFFFFYLGVVVTASGWVVEYLVDVRDGDAALMGYVPAGFSGGCLLGRILLPEPTHRFGEKKMVALYCVLCLGFQLLFWLVPNIIAASVAISLLGFFSGPFFATAVSVGARLFPAEISATAMSFVFVFAQVGGSLFPIVTGVLGAEVGVSVMQPILVGLIVATAVSWLLVPQPKGKTS